MNILFVWTSPFKNGGGVGRVTTTLGSAFKERGHNVYYFSYSDGEDYIHEGIQQFFSPHTGAPDAKVNTEYLKRIIADNDINVVINQAGLSKPDVLKAINIVRSDLGLDEQLTILTVHHNCVACLYKHFELVIKDNFKDHWLYPVISNKAVLTLLKRRHKRKYGHILTDLINNSDSLVLLSEKFIPDLAIYLDQVPDKKVAGIPNPAPFKSVNVEHKKENRLLYVGRINFHQKRADLLVELWKKMQSKYPDWEFDIVGDGESLGNLKAMARNANLERIHFHGYQDPEPYLEKAKFFVMTSAFEGFGMVLVEAQAYGVVPFAFNCFSSLSDVLQDQENGVVTSPFDIDAYAEKLARLMGDEQRRREMAARARESVKKFDPTTIAQEWEILFLASKQNQDSLQALSI